MAATLCWWIRRPELHCEAQAIQDDVENIPRPCEVVFVRKFWVATVPGGDLAMVSYCN